MEPTTQSADTPIKEVTEWRPASDAKFAVSADSQPYVKLHGSSNWVDPVDPQRRMLVIGGNKPEAIGRHAILKWNHEQFRAYLSKPETRLMVSGYSFGDDHINDAIEKSVDGGTLRLFIINPLGVDVLDRRKRPLPLLPLLDLFFEKLKPYVIGASRRPLSETFGDDGVEHGKVMRFFD